MPSFGKILTAVLREKCSRTNQLTNYPTIRSLTSTDVENCNVPRGTGSTSVFCLLSSVFCLLSTVYCLQSTIYSLQSTVYCLLSTGNCLQSTVFSFLSSLLFSVFCLQIGTNPSLIKPILDLN